MGKSGPNVAADARRLLGKYAPGSVVRVILEHLRGVRPETGATKSLRVDSSPPPQPSVFGRIWDPQEAHDNAKHSFEALDERGFPHGKQH